MVESKYVPPRVLDLAVGAYELAQESKDPTIHTYALDIMEDLGFPRDFSLISRSDLEERINNIRGNNYLYGGEE
jgi:hypothetical protein